MLPIELIETILTDNTINIDFWVGRKDCDSSKGMPKRTFIQHHEMDGMKRLSDLFGLTPEECVALMGKYWI